MEEKAGGISPPSPIHIVLTPSEREALQAILNAQRHPNVVNPWYSDATITFDHYPFNFTPIPPGTKLTVDQPYSLGYGAQFTSLPAGNPVYAVSAAYFSNQAGNVVSLNNYPQSGTKTTYSTFTESDGMIVATPITRQQADISAVAFTILGTAPEPVGVVFDNLHFKRPT